MEIISDPDLKILNSRAAELFINHTKDILDRNDHAVWALPGGRSVGGIFDLLPEMDDLEWNRIHFFMADERLVPIDDEESNFKLLKERLLLPLLVGKKITKKNIHPFIYRPEEDDAGINKYEQDLKRYGGRYDIVLLSSGEDGHVAGLYPDHHSIDDDSGYFIKMDDSPKPPPSRMSSSRTLLSNSGAAVLLFYGEGKKDALNMFMDPSLTSRQCPAKIINQVKKPYVLTDQGMIRW